MSKRTPKLDPVQVREYFDYEDGVLIWRISPANHVAVGSVAGCQRKGGNSVTINLKGKCYLRSHLVIAWHTGTWPGACVRHLNNDLTDDRIGNLAHETYFERVLRIRELPDKTPGVQAAGKRWTASISIDCKPLHLGTYDTEAEAHAAFVKAHVAIHGADSPYVEPGAPKC